MNLSIKQRPALYFENDAIVAAVFGRKELASLEEGSDETRRTLEKEFLSSQFGIDPDQIFFLRQVHGDRSVPILSETVNGPTPYFDSGDALFTDCVGKLLCIRTADCLPLFFYAGEPEHTVAGVIHAGWKGIHHGIIEKALDRVERQYRLSGSQFHLFSGPCIEKDRYEVRRDVADLFALKRQTDPDHFLLDLRGNAALQFPNKELFSSFHGCTVAENGRYYSHRRGDTGRNLNTILIKDKHHG